MGDDGGVMGAVLLLGVGVGVFYLWKKGQLANILDLIKLPTGGDGGGGGKTPTTGGGKTPSGGTSPPATGGGGNTAGGQLTQEGIKTPFRLTGKSVKMNVGAKHANGDRYNCNHTLKNYYFVGYFKTTGSGLIEIKIDGPNHGSGNYNCGSGKLNGTACEWVELDFEVANGTSYISSEWPHPTNHPRISADYAKKLSGSFVNKWVGFGAAAYQVGKYRKYEIWIDPGGLKSNQWVKTLSHLNDDTRLIPHPTRALPTAGKAMEAEIRMHGQHGTAMQFGRVVEIAAPSGSAYTNTTMSSYTYGIGRNMPLIGLYRPMSRQTVIPTLP